MEKMNKNEKHEKSAKKISKGKKYNCNKLLSCRNPKVVKIKLNKLGKSNDNNFLKVICPIFEHIIKCR